MFFQEKKQASWCLARGSATARREAKESPSPAVGWCTVPSGRDRESKTGRCAKDQNKLECKNMENSDDKFVYHGSPREFDSEYANPKRSIRQRWNKETEAYDIIFDQEAFHATPHRWIALAYTYKSAPFEIDGKTAHYSMGVSLYQNTKDVGIFGFNSLEESLKVMYGDGGYLYYFDKGAFLHKEGLGNLEVVAEKPIKPVTIERVDDPVAEMKKLGVTFNFFDLALPENEKDRNYY
jgi:hypothetical protein